MLSILPQDCLWQDCQHGRLSWGQEGTAALARVNWWKPIIFQWAKCKAQSTVLFPYREKPTTVETQNRIVLSRQGARIFLCEGEDCQTDIGSVMLSYSGEVVLHELPWTRAAKQLYDSSLAQFSIPSIPVPLEEACWCCSRMTEPCWLWLTVAVRFQAFPLLPVQWVWGDSRKGHRSPAPQCGEPAHLCRGSFFVPSCCFRDVFSKPHPLTVSIPQKLWELLGNAAVEGQQGACKYGAHDYMKSSTVKFRKLPDNFAKLVPVTIFDTED